MITELSLACVNGDEDEVKRLLSEGHDPNAQHTFHDVVQFGWPSTIQLLLEHGANPTLKDEYGRTPLSLASEENRTVIIEYEEKQLEKVVVETAPARRRMRI